MLIGYMRPYQGDINCDEQYKVLTEKRCHKVISEPHASAKRRTTLEKLLDSLQEGDKIIISKLYAIADSTRHLTELLEKINNRGAYLQSIQEEIDTSNAESYSFTHIVKHLTAFQSDVVSEQTKAGMMKAKEKGGPVGRPRKPDRNVQRAIEMHQSKNYSLAEIKQETGISKSTLYRYLES